MFLFNAYVRHLLEHKNGTVVVLQVIIAGLVERKIGARYANNLPLHENAGAKNNYFKLRNKT